MGSGTGQTGSVGQVLWQIQQNANAAKGDARPKKPSKKVQPENPLLASPDTTQNLCSRRNGQKCYDLNGAVIIEDAKRRDFRRSILDPQSGLPAHPLLQLDVPPPGFSADWVRTGDGQIIGEIPSFDISYKGKTVVAFINPTARSGDIGDLKDGITESLKGMGAADVIVYETIKGDNAAFSHDKLMEIHQSKGAGNQMIVIGIGGDGTMDDVAEGTRRTNMSISEGKPSSGPFPSQVVGVMVPIVAGTASDIANVSGAVDATVLAQSNAEIIEYLKKGVVIWHHPVEGNFKLVTGESRPFRTSHTISGGATGALFNAFDTWRDNRVESARRRVEFIRGRREFYPTEEAWQKALDKAEAKLKAVQYKKVAHYVALGFKVFPKYIAGKSFNCTVHVNGQPVYNGPIAGIELDNVVRIAGGMRVPGVTGDVGGQSYLFIIPPGPVGLEFIVEMTGRNFGSETSVTPGSRINALSGNLAIPLPPGADVKISFSDPAPVQIGGDGKGYVTEIEAQVATAPYPIVVSQESLAAQSRPYRGVEGRVGEERERARRAFTRPNQIDALAQHPAGIDFIPIDQRPQLIHPQLIENCQKLAELEKVLGEKGVNPEQIQRVISLTGDAYIAELASLLAEGKIDTAQAAELTQLRDGLVGLVTDSMAQLANENVRRLIFMSEGEFEHFLRNNSLSPEEIRALQTLRNSPLRQLAIAYDTEAINAYMETPEGQRLAESNIFQEMVLDQRHLWDITASRYTLRQVTPEVSFQFLQLLCLEGGFGVPGILDTVGLTHDSPLARTVGLFAALIASEQTGEWIKYRMINPQLSTPVPIQALRTIGYWRSFGAGLARAGVAGRTAREVTHLFGAQRNGEVSHIAGLAGMSVTLVPGAYLQNRLRQAPTRVHSSILNHPLVKLTKVVNIAAIVGEATNLIGNFILDPLANDNLELYWENWAYQSYLADNSGEGILKSIGSDVPFSERFGHTIGWFGVNIPDIVSGYATKKALKHSPIDSMMQTKYLWPMAAKHRDAARDVFTRLALVDVIQNSNPERPNINWENIFDEINNGDDENIALFRKHLQSWHVLAYLCNDPHKAITSGGISREGKLKPTKEFIAWLQPWVRDELKKRRESLRHDLSISLNQLHSTPLSPDEISKQERNLKIVFATIDLKIGAMLRKLG